jgi:hypothetical protein
MQDNYRAFKAWLLLHNDSEIDRVRRALEADRFSRYIVARHPNRHLYAVLKPNRLENLSRIDSIFGGLSVEKSKSLLDAINRRIEGHNLFHS